VQQITQAVQGPLQQQQQQEGLGLVLLPLVLLVVWSLKLKCLQWFQVRGWGWGAPRKLTLAV
jgi:hypothetical protein